MGRAKGKQPINNNERSRNLSFSKRKKGLKKKLSELSTLCDVQACMICYGPNGELVTWPEEHPLVRSILQRYDNISVDMRDKYQDNILSVIDKKKKELHKQQHLQSVRINCSDESSSYPTWDDRLDKLSEDGLRDLVQNLDEKLEKLRQRADFLNMVNQTMATDYQGKPVFDVDPTMGSDQKFQNRFLPHQPLPLPTSSGDFAGTSSAAQCDPSCRQFCDTTGNTPFGDWAETSFGGQCESSWRQFLETTGFTAFDDCAGTSFGGPSDQSWMQSGFEIGNVVVLSDDNAEEFSFQSVPMTIAQSMPLYGLQDQVRDAYFSDFDFNGDVLQCS